MVLHPLPPSFIILFHKSKQTFKKGKLDRNLAAWVSVIGINTIIQHCCKSCLKIWFTWHKKKTYEEVCMCMKTVETLCPQMSNRCRIWPWNFRNWSGLHGEHSWQKKKKKKKKKQNQTWNQIRKTTKTKKMKKNQTVLALQSSLQNAFSALELPAKATLFNDLSLSGRVGELFNCHRRSRGDTEKPFLKITPGFY